MQPNEDPNNTANWTGAQFEDGSGMTFNDRVPAFGGMSNGGGAAAMSPGGGSPMSQDPMAQKAFQKVQQYEGEARGARSEGEKKEGPIREKLMSVLESPPAAQAHLKEVQAQPKPEDYHKGALEFAGAMAVVGAIFGRGSRGSGNVALNAFGAALKGFQEGNLQAYTEATKEWEQATKATIANNQIELDKYKMIIEDKKLNIDQMSAAINLVSTETQNKIMFDMSMAKNYTGFLTAYDKQQAAQQRLELSLKRSQSLDEKSQAPLRAAAEDLVAHPEKGSAYTAEQWAKIKGYADSHGIALPDQPQPKGAPPPASAPGAPPAGMTKEQFDYIADQYNAIGPSALGNLGYGKDVSAMKQAVVKHAADRAMAGGQTGAEVATGRADFKSLGTALTALEKQKAAIGQFENTAIKNGDYLVQLANKVDKTGVPVIERWLRAGRQNLAGDADVSTFNAQLRAYSNEVAKIITSPNLTGVLSDNARREAQSFLPEQASAKQIKAVVELFKRDFGNRKSSIDQEIASVKSQMSGKGGAAPAGGDDGWTVKEK